MYQLHPLKPLSLDWLPEYNEGFYYSKAADNQDAQ